MIRYLPVTWPRLTPDLLLIRSYWNVLLRLAWRRHRLDLNRDGRRPVQPGEWSRFECTFQESRLKLNLLFPFEKCARTRFVRSFCDSIQDYQTEMRSYRFKVWRPEVESRISWFGYTILFAADYIYILLYSPVATRFSNLIDTDLAQILLYAAYDDAVFNDFFIFQFSQY